MTGSQFRDVAEEFRVQEHAARGDMRALTDALRNDLARGTSSPFALARDFAFTNTTGEVREWLERCAGLLHAEYPNFPSLYTEMNGFDINPDRWFASLMAWTEPIPPDASQDEWDGGDVGLHYREDLTLTGAEAMQAAFEWWLPKEQARELTDDDKRDVALAQWLVWSMWLSLLQSAWQAGPLTGVRVSLVATAHDCDVMLRLDPPSGVTQE